MEALIRSLALYAGNSPMTGELPSQKTSNADLDVFYVTLQNVKQTVEWPVIWDPLKFMWRHCNGVVCIEVVLGWDMVRLGASSVYITMTS